MSGMVEECEDQCRWEKMGSGEVQENVGVGFKIPDPPPSLSYHLSLNQTLEEMAKKSVLMHLGRRQEAPQMQLNHRCQIATFFIVSTSSPIPIFL